MATETGTIRLRIMFPTSPEALFEMLTEPSKIAAYTKMAAGGPDETGVMTAGNGYIRFRNVDLERGKRVVQEWTTAEWPADLPPSRLEFRLNPAGRGTELAVEQTGVPLSDLERYEEGWHVHYWTPLFNHLRVLSKKQ